MAEELELYKIPAIDTSLSQDVNNPAKINVSDGGSVGGTSGLNEQQVRDIVGQNISTGLKEDQVRNIVKSTNGKDIEELVRNAVKPLIDSIGTIISESQVRTIVANALRSSNLMSEDKVRDIVNSMQKFLTGQNVMMDGIQRSQNFSSGVQGWQIDAEGNAEFNDGVFRGDVVLGNTIRTVDTASEIQTAIDEVSLAGGGSIYLAPGTYNMTSDINIPSYVYLIGAARDAVIIDFGGTAHSIISTGTIGTHNIDVALINLTVQNSSSYGVYLQYLDNSKLDGLNVYSCSYGLFMDNCSAVGLVGDGGYFDGNGTGMKLTNSTACSIYFTTFSNSASGHGLEMNTCTNMTLLDSEISTNSADGINLTACSNIGFLSLSVHDNGGQGIELVSGCNDLQFSHTVIDGNTSDGVKLTSTSDRNTIVAVTVSNNGGYGINIAASSCDNNQITSPAFDSNTSGNINDSGTNTTILPNNPYLTASQDLTAGQPVGISNLTGGVALAKVTTTSVAHGITAPQFNGDKANCFAPIGGDKFVMLNYTTAGSDTLFAQVGSVNRGTMTISLGTPQTVATAFTPIGVSLPGCCVCKLDTDKFIVFYLLDGSTTAIKYRVGTVSGTTITFGTEATFFTAASTVATSNGFTADQISTDKGIFVFKAASSGDSRMVAFTVSGTVATAGTGVAPGGSSNANTFSYVKKIATDKYVLVTQNSSTNLFALVCTLSGTTITAGSEVKISATAFTVSINGFNIVNPATDVFVVAWGNSNYYAVACTVSGTTPTAGSTLDTGIASGTGIYAQNATTLYWDASNTGKKMSKLVLSGSTLTNTVDVAAIYTTTASLQAFIPVDNGYFLVVGVLSDATNIGFWIEGMSNNWVGFVASTVSRGIPVAVNIKGSVNSSQSGLTSGCFYLINNGILNPVINTVSVNSLDDVDVGIAVDSTRIII